jgi:hypothetical protein
MVAILYALASIFEFRIRSRASLELELIALRHHVAVLRQQHPGRPHLSSLDLLMASQRLPSSLALALIVLDVPRST